MKTFFRAIALLFIFDLAFAQSPTLFPLENIRLLESPFKHAQELDLAYLMAMDADKLLAPYLRESGLEVKARSYGNWESSGLDGHIGGHYLSALSLAYASTGDALYRQRLDYFVSELKRAQDANGNGYIGGVPGSAKLWGEVAKGNIQVELFSLNERWVPWYNLHKTFAGLRDAYVLGKNKQAFTLLIKLSDWAVKLTEKLQPEQIQQMLLAEHGGMNEVFADVYALTGDTRYLTLARKFSDQRILNPLLASQDKLDGLHANTQIPKVVGFARIAQQTNDGSWWKAADYFWQVVADQRSAAIGGNSAREHFHPKSDFSPMLEDAEGPETCNTYNMLKLSALLYQHNGATDYVEFYERALYNHILSSQHPETGGLVYFTPMRPQHYRVYSQVDKAMWCCVGSGIENHLKYGEFIYAHSGSALFVNLFIPSRLDWKEKGIVLRQENDLPDSEITTFTIEKGGKFELHLRQPQWLSKKMTVALNGKPVTGTIRNGYLVLERDWQQGDRLVINLPMKTRLEPLPDGSNYYAVLHGPVVLGAPVAKRGESLDFFADDSRMGHIAMGNLCPLSDAPVFLSDDEDVLTKIKRVPGDTLKFTATELIGNTTQRLELIPFFRVHETRYMVYWLMTSRQDLRKMKKAQAVREKAKLELEARTVDKVSPGEQQPEAEHNYKGEGAEAGVHRGRHWRHARGWFSYELRNPDQSAKTLRITFNGEDSGRVFHILLNGTIIDTIKSDGSAGPVFIDQDYDLPESVSTSKIIEVKFKAAEGSIAGGVFGIRLLR